MPVSGRTDFSHDEVLGAIIELGKENPNMAKILAHTHFCVESYKSDFDQLVNKLPQMIQDAVKKEIDKAASTLLSSRDARNARWVTGVGAACALLAAVAGFIEVWNRVHP